MLTADGTFKLQSFCWYVIALHFGLRGGQVFAQFKVSDLVFKKDEGGKDFVQLHSDFSTKNTPSGTKSKEFSTCGRIQDEMQVAALKRMIHFLKPGVQRLFQRVLLGRRDRQKGPWFARMALGHNQLKDMMPNLSVRANLRKRYTNHLPAGQRGDDL